MADCSRMKATFQCGFQLQLLNSVITLSRDELSSPDIFVLHFSTDACSGFNLIPFEDGQNSHLIYLLSVTVWDEHKFSDEN